MIFACCSLCLPASSPWIDVVVSFPAQSPPVLWSPQPAPPPALQSPAGRHSAALTDAPAVAPSSAVLPTYTRMWTDTHIECVTAVIQTLTCLKCSLLSHQVDVVRRDFKSQSFANGFNQSRDVDPVIHLTEFF